MQPSLCRLMAAILPVSPSHELSRRIRRPPQRFLLGFHAGSWQHRYLDCGTLNLSGRCGRGAKPRGRRSAARRQVGGVAGSAVAGRSRRWQAPAW